QMRPRCRRAAASFRRHLVEKEIGERRAGERAAVGKDAQQAVVARVEAALDVVEELPAELQRLTSADPRQLVVDLKCLVERVGVARAGAERRQAGAPPDRAETRN